MYRFDELTKSERTTMGIIGAGVVPDDFHWSAPGRRGIKKLVQLSLAEKNPVGSWRLTPAGKLIWRRKLKNIYE